MTSRPGMPGPGSGATEPVPVLWIDTSGLARAESLFGLAPLERLRRSIGKTAARVVISGPGAATANWPGAQIDADAAPLVTRLERALAKMPHLVAVDGATVIDPRLIQFLGKVEAPCVASRGEGVGRAVAMRLDASSQTHLPAHTFASAISSDVVDAATSVAIPQDATDLAAVADALLVQGVIAPLDEHSFPAYIDKLRRSLPYWIYRVDDAASRRQLERKMFLDNYKGSTDFLTSHVYPPLVWPAVRFCVRWRIHPNTVTVLSIILAFAAVPLFAGAHWVAGFVCAYVMSVLDSVDGKLARLTLTDSAIGNVLDHGLDQVHPPFWYFAWAWGLGGRSWEDPLYQAAVWLIVFYFADRIVLGIGRARMGHALHASTPLDERVRSVIARRNITMTIMALALLVGAGPAGFIIVTAWQGLTFAWHAWRTLWLGFLSSAHRRREA